MAHAPPPSASSPQLASGTIEAPPTTVLGILSRLGPGLIIAASIVGSGELIGTTKTGADAGYSLLWLVLIGCVIKVFVQVELGRFTISEGRTTMEAMNLIGPRFGVSWMIWYWLLMFLVGLGQLGGIVGGVGQALAITFPTADGFAAHLNASTPLPRFASFADLNWANILAVLHTDDVLWSIGVTAMTSVLLVVGRYRLVQNVSTVLVAGFTVVTIFNLVALPWFSEVRFSWADIREGMMLHLPEARPGKLPLATALATFGIIGVGANELIAYPYWCIEKGYAQFTGPRDDTPGWGQRARGWLRVMRWDAWCSMIIYTLATVTFYLLGAVVLHPRGLSPADDRLIETLAIMYRDVFGTWGNYVFLFGAFAVLYSTFFVAIAGHARVVADAVRVYGLGAHNERTRTWWVTVFSGLFPFLSLACYILYRDPVGMVLLSGFMQALMLPMLGGASLYFRYRRSDPRVRPGLAWDAMLWISFAGLLVAGLWAAGVEIAHLWELASGKA
ncbi:MAG TPA: Nramp family divalent metal transporter [Pirellulales bacterium]|nr:Nramp family divalent metal transporter [Pirellulales bacterium]